jgi:hypothetical protein
MNLAGAEFLSSSNLRYAADSVSTAGVTLQGLCGELLAD